MQMPVLDGFWITTSIRIVRIVKDRIKFVERDERGKEW